MRRARLAWRRVRHVFVCVADGHGFFEPSNFEAYFADLEPMGFRAFLCVAAGAPLLTARQRRRTFELPGVTDITLAIVFDGNPVTRGMASMFALFMPKTTVLRGDRLDEGLDALGAVDADLRDELTRVVAELKQEIADGRRDERHSWPPAGV